MAVKRRKHDTDAVLATINTTPLVDVMLVMLIIFLITIPVVITVIPVDLPIANDKATQTKPQDVNLAIDENGQIYWNLEPIPNLDALSQRLRAVAVLKPQPQLHIRADKEARFESVGRVILVAQRNAIMKMAFIVEPVPKQ